MLLTFKALRETKFSGYSSLLALIFGLSISVISAILFIASAGAQTSRTIKCTDETRDRVDENLNNSVQIFIENNQKQEYIGSGIILNDSGEILTAAHVLFGKDRRPPAQYNKVTVKIINQAREYTAVLPDQYFVNYEFDLAILRFSGEDSPESMDFRNIAFNNSRNVKENDLVYYYDWKSAQTAVSGVRSAHREINFRIADKLPGAYSGSSILDCDGDILGIITKSSRDVRDYSELVPSETVMYYLSLLGVDHIRPVNYKPSSVETRLVLLERRSNYHTEKLLPIEEEIHHIKQDIRWKLETVRERATVSDSETRASDDFLEISYKKVLESQYDVKAISYWFCFTVSPEEMEPECGKKKTSLERRSEATEGKIKDKKVLVSLSGIWGRIDNYLETERALDRGNHTLEDVAKIVVSGVPLVVHDRGVEQDVPMPLMRWVRNARDLKK